MKFRNIIVFIYVAVILSVTGLSISAEETDYVSDPEIFYGDINGDMKITAADYIAFMKYYTGYIKLPDFAILKADIDSVSS